MAVRDRYPQALGCKGRGLCGYNHPIFKLAPDLQRFLLRFFLLAADIRNHVIHHFRPALEGFAGPGDRLVGADQGLFDPKFGEGEEGGNIALERTVGFDRHKSPFGAQPLPLERDNRGMLGI